MSISTRQELIKQLEAGNPDEVLVYTYWGESDFEPYKDKDSAQELIDEQLESCMAHANDWLELNYAND